MKKKIISILLIGCMIAGISVNVLAEETNETSAKEEQLEMISQKSNNIFQFSDLCCDTYDAEGNLISSEIIPYNVNINNSILGAGQTKSYYPSGNPNGFYFTANKIFYVSLNLNQSANLYTYLENGTGVMSNEKNPFLVLKSYVTGYQRLYIKNNSNISVTINGTIIY